MSLLSFFERRVWFLVEGGLEYFTRKQTNKNVLFMDMVEIFYALINQQSKYTFKTGIMSG